MLEHTIKTTTSARHSFPEKNVVKRGKCQYCGQGWNGHKDSPCPKALEAKLTRLKKQLDGAQAVRDLLLPLEEDKREVVFVFISDCRMI